MANYKKAAPAAGTGTASRIAFPAPKSITTPVLHCWFISLPTTTCIISMVAPMAAALADMIAGGRL